MAASFQDFVSTFVAPPLEQAGFIRTGDDFLYDRYNVVLFSIRERNMIGTISFYPEWAIIPKASIDYFRLRDDEAHPGTFWGIMSARVPAPRGVSADEISMGSWVLPDGAAVARGGAVLLDILTTSLVPMFLKRVHSNALLYATGPSLFDGGLPCSTPSGSAERYIAIHIDDGEPARLKRLLDKLRATGQDPEWETFWRQRLDRRLAAGQ